MIEKHRFGTNACTSLATPYRLASPMFYAKRDRAEGHTVNHSHEGLSVALSYYIPWWQEP